MALQPGDKLGPYEILAPIGKGGMGEVWKARDTRLDRIVALKVSDAQFSERFEREARAVAALNHPNICQLYDVGPDYLVMEYIEGTPLKGPLPIDQALKYAVQICDALDAAHKKGITHRDLKPANILVTKPGIKLLDFGLAKLNSPVAKPISNATLTMALTGKNEIVGTLYYMSPEQLQAQANGQEVDSRSDIFSFGLVLYEILTGKRAFEGSSPASVIAAIMERPAPSIATIAPAALDRLLQRCLAKDPDDRWQSARDLRAELEWIAAPSGAQEPGIAVPRIQRSERSRKLLWVAAGALALSAAIASGFAWNAMHPVTRPTARFNDDLGMELSVAPAFGVPIAISPDGTRLAFVTRGSDGIARLALRVLDSSKSSVFASTEGAGGPFWSPDSRSIGFFAAGKLNKIPAQGGVPVVICAAPAPRGGTWGEDDTIIFDGRSRGPLLRVSANGGTPQPITKLEGAGVTSHRFPQMLPRSDAFLFTIDRSANYDLASIDVQSVKTGATKTLVQGAYFAKYLSSGHLLYMRRTTLYAAPMDLSRLEITGAEVPVLEDVSGRIGNALAYFDTGRSGDLIYVPKEGDVSANALYWIDPNGALQQMQLPPGRYENPSISPDGTHVALSLTDGQDSNLADYEIAGNRLAKLSFFKGQATSTRAVWAPDGKHLVFEVVSGTLDGLYWVRADGAGQPQRFLVGRDHAPSYFSSDGKRLTYADLAAPYQISTLQLDFTDPEHPKASKSENVLSVDSELANPALSPDGKWLAYVSSENGARELYVRPADGPSKGEGRWLVSSGGGGTPFWSRNSRELLYQHRPDGRPWVVGYSVSGDMFIPGKPRPWMEKMPVAKLPDGDLAPDGKRFMLVLPVNPSEQKTPTHVTFLLNFADELRRKVPPGK